MKTTTLITMMLIAFMGFSQAATLPLDFESGTSEWTDFDGGSLTIVDNTQMSGINTSAKVAQMVKSADKIWGGSFIMLDAPIDFSTNKKFKMKVFSPRVGAKVLLKVENADNGAIAFEKEVVTTVANEWEELIFDYSLIDVSKSFQKIVVIFDLGIMGDGSANFTFLLDDIVLYSDGNVTEAPAFPIDFESSTIAYGLVDFDGAGTTIMPNPQISGINQSAMVTQLIRNGGAVWAGSKMILSRDIDFSQDGGLSMKVFTSAPVGTMVKFKLEGTAQIEKDMFTTVSNAWETIVWDFTGTASDTYNTLVFMFDFGKTGDGTANSTFLFDDVMQVNLSGGLAQINLPVTFDDETMNYALTDFEGASTVLGVDPMNANNKVAITTKPVEGKPWAGTTIGTAVGFASRIPLSTTKSQISVMVYSPTVGTIVRLKLEDHKDVTLTVETEATTTVANTWEKLIFDFNNVAPGSNPFNPNTNFDKASIFFGFGTEGVAGVYYWDDVMFMESTPVSTVNAESIKIYAANGMVLVNSTENSINGTIEIYELSGKKVWSSKISGSTEQVNMTSKGIYVVRILDVNQTSLKAQKVYIK